MTRFVLVALTYLYVSSVAFSQNTPPSDPQALALAAQAVAATTGGATINDVTLTGSVTWNGSDTGTATLNALGASESRMDLALTSGTRTEIRDAQTGIQQGQWVAPNNSSGYFAGHNCRTDPVWFFPALGSLAGGPNIILSYIGLENWNGGTVQHIQSFVYQSTRLPGPGPQQLSTMDFYLDATTYLPVAVTFNAHPDNDATTNLPIEIDFSNYQTANGIAVPTHIRRFQQGNLMVDVWVSGASFNTGLSLPTFTIN